MVFIQLQITKNCIIKRQNELTNVFVTSLKLSTHFQHKSIHFNNKWNGHFREDIKVFIGIF